MVGSRAGAEDGWGESTIGMLVGEGPLPGRKFVPDWGDGAGVSLGGLVEPFSTLGLLLLVATTATTAPNPIKTSRLAPTRSSTQTTFRRLAPQQALVRLGAGSCPAEVKPPITELGWDDEGVALLSPGVVIGTGEACATSTPAGTTIALAWGCWRCPSRSCCGVSHWSLKPMSEGTSMGELDVIFALGSNVACVGGRLCVVAVVAPRLVARCVLGLLKKSRSLFRFRHVQSHGRSRSRVS